MGSLFDTDDEDQYTYSDYQQQEKPAKEKRPITGWVVLLLIELIALVIMITAIIQIRIRNAWSNMNIKEMSEEELLINSGANKDAKGYTNIAFFGLDARNDSLERGSYSDSMMIISINNDTKDVKIVSLYRDTLFRIPGQGLNAKANSAFNYGGPVLGVQMLNQNLDLNISEYITVNWEALTRAIDILGGVTVDVTKEELVQMIEYIGGKHLAAECYHFP